MNDKKCGRCKDNKPADEFNSKFDGLQSYCRDCQKIVWQTLADKYATEARTERLAKQREARKLIAKEYISTYKQENPCKDCDGKFNPWQMDFDHLDPELKKSGLAEMQNAGYSLEVIKLEIAKCELVCANCHRNRTHEREIADKH